MEVKAIGPGAGLEGATVVVGVMADLVPAAGSEDIVSSIDPALFAAAGFDGSPLQTLLLPHDQAECVLLVGLGEAVSFEQLRAATGNAIRAVRTAKVVSYLDRIPLEDAGRAVLEGAVLGSYSFRDFKTTDSNGAPAILELSKADEAEIAESLPAAEAVNMVRDWVNTPASSLSPDSLARRIEEAGLEVGLGVEVWDEERISDERLGGLLGVAAGSNRPPRLVVLQHSPAGAERHLGLVGKGITFDSGGLSIKPAKSMEEMKDDMAGGAAVAAATVAMARLGLPLRVTTIVPISDNVIGGDAMRPGDVLRPVAGPTIEVLNTDAEGRLILADGLGLMTGFEPDLTIDVATLTGSAHVALGHQIAALFATDHQTSTMLLEASARAGENLWEMPLFEPYKKGLDSEVADTKNVTGSRYGGAITAALFLSNYAGDGPWAHLDIASTARCRETSGEQVKGASGYGVRTLVEVARRMAESS